MLEDLTVIIPALKKRVAFQDDLVKKLDGITLIQRAINKAMEFRCGRKQIHVLTDSDEIRLIAERNEVQCYYDAGLVFEGDSSSGDIWEFIEGVASSTSMLLVLSPYSPLLPANLVLQAIDTLGLAEEGILRPVVRIPMRVSRTIGNGTLAGIFATEHRETEMVSPSFTVLKRSALISRTGDSLGILHWPIPNDYPDINSFHDWWVCERLIKRKRIVFRVIGDEQVGMGHIYRALSLAHEIVNHEVLFVTDTSNAIAVSRLAGYDYWLEAYEPDDVVRRIAELKPDLVVNDILATSADDVMPLLVQGCRVMNFEDLGEGAGLADLTINELYDNPQFEGESIYWGHRYFFVRDEFHEAHPLRFRRRVSDILITFGGTDQHDLARKVFPVVNTLCQERGIRIHIAAGAGYAGYDELHRIVGEFEHVSLTRSTGVISRIMEKCQVAIVSNGRTVYELAHMNIPSIVISQHERENTHEFACEENGFISLGVYHEIPLEHMLAEALTRLLDDEEYRHDLFNRTTRFDFSKNKQKVLAMILSLLDGGTAGDTASVGSIQRRSTFPVQGNGMSL